MASRKSRRGLSDDDKEVWARVARTVAPVQAPTFSEIFEPKKSSGKPTPTPIERFEITSMPERRVTISRLPDPSDALRDAKPQMDRKNFDRLRKGKFSPDRRIDLHGLTIDRAHQALRSFIISAHADGARLALVITGKGRSLSETDGVMPQRRGVIRHAVPEWLRQFPLNDKVVQVIPAHRKHGGDGAYYVYLKRKR